MSSAALPATSKLTVPDTRKESVPPLSIRPYTGVRVSDVVLRTGVNGISSGPAALEPSGEPRYSKRSPGNRPSSARAGGATDRGCRVAGDGATGTRAVK